MMPLPKLPEGLPSAWLLDCEIFAESIRPDPDLTIRQWAEQHRVLSAETSAEPGPWRTERVPHTGEIMDELSPSSPTQEVTWVAGTQVAKTEVGNNFCGFVIDWAPGPMMMVYPTSNTGKRSSRTRLSKMIDATPRLRAKISEHARDKSNSASLKEFPGGVLAIAGANSAAELKSMPVKYLFEDEVDEYPDDVDGQGPADELAEKRTDTFPRKKIYRTSTPTEKGRSKIWRHYERSDKRRYFVPCPHCAAEQVLKWEQFRYETRRVWEVVRADDGEIVEVPDGTEGAKSRDTGDLVDVWYECEACAARIEDHDKTAMLERGRWIAERPEVKGHAGFHLPAFYSPVGWFSWRQVVQKRLEADKDPSGHLLKIWTNTVAALPFVAASEEISDSGLKNRAEAYRLGTVPKGGLLLVASVDVQANRLEVKVKAYGRGEESWLVGYEQIFGDTETSAPWEALDEYAQRKFPHESGATLRILALAVDAGYRTQTVYDWCRRRRHRNIFPVRGQSQPGKTILGRPTQQDVDHRGAKVHGGVDLWPIGTDTAKSKIYARLKITEPGPGCMHFPLGLPDEYYKQLTAERLVSRYHRGFLKRVWEKEASERNEALDLEVYAYAAAIYIGVARLNWDRVEAALLSTAGDLFVQDQARREAAAAAQIAAAEEPAVQTSEPPEGKAPEEKKAAWMPRRGDWLRRH
jgi:phage terminase large subunit GpA-like protein